MSDVILDTVYKHLQGKHDQKTHGRRWGNITVEGVHPKVVKRIKDKIREAAKKADVPNNIKIVYKNAFGRVSEHGGLVAADYRKDIDTITIYNGTSYKEMPGVLAHEYGHHIFRKVMDKGNTSELATIANKHKLYSSPPEFSSYAKKVWKVDMLQGINESVSEVYRLYSQGKRSAVPVEWQEYADAVRNIYDNLP